tara:strand:+ start:58 stop:444 length:387 start_codon:yes stop_codon:yes gene_type:complete
MSIDNATPEEWNRLSRGPDKPEDCLMSAQSTKTITGSLYHPSDSLLDNTMFPKEEPKDNVNHPPHYNKGGLEAIDYIQQQLGDGFSDYLEGNVTKYLHRYKYKNGVEDLKKAEWYLKKLIEEHTFNYG